MSMALVEKLQRPPSHRSSSSSSSRVAPMPQPSSNRRAEGNKSSSSSSSNISNSSSPNRSLNPFPSLSGHKYTTPTPITIPSHTSRLSNAHITPLGLPCSPSVRSSSFAQNPFFPADISFPSEYSSSYTSTATASTASTMTTTPQSARSFSMPLPEFEGRRKDPLERALGLHYYNNTVTSPPPFINRTEESDEDEERDGEDATRDSGRNGGMKVRMARFMHNVRRRFSTGGIMGGSSKKYVMNVTLPYRQQEQQQRDEEERARGSSLA